MKSRLSYALLVLLLALSITVSAYAPVAASPPAKSDSRVYIVYMVDDPVAAYQGDIAGYEATKPTTGGKVERFSAKVQNYSHFLKEKHNEVLATTGIEPETKIYDYSFALNGFAVQLTPSEAEALAKKPGVLRVVPDQMRYKTTDSSPGFLGLTGKKGVYAKGITGEGVVVGVIDTGIWPEHPSFADDGSYGPPPVTPVDTPEHPACEFGNTVHNPDDAPFTCNNKLIGARKFLEGYKLAVGGLVPDEYDSARDDDGHGTHTASTAAGNANVKASVLGISRGAISGIAPRARVIAYKALGNLGGMSSDLAAAIDQAVADGVDVINYSIGGGASLTSADDLAFLFAADAGVFVATSAGNSGPGAETIGGPGSVPWITTVGASTQKRFFEGRVLLGNGKVYTGASITGGTGVLLLVDAGALGNLVCDPDVPFSGDISGKIVLCERGVVDRVAKSLAVFNAGGAGMILYNLDDVGDLASDTHWLPSVHVDLKSGEAIRAYIASKPNPTARIYGGKPSKWAPAPSMAQFSSRGPDPVALDIIKPDVTAPGMHILAGNSPTPDAGFVPGELFQAIQGTSMSSPHVAGVYALLKQAHPDWTPAMAKSALMTTASQNVKNNDRVSLAGPFDMGAGHINPGGNLAQGSPFTPGLVYDAGFNEYLGFLCDADPSVFANPEGTCAALAGAGIPTEARNLNLASIGIAEVTGSQTVVRTVTSVASGKRTFKVTVKAPPGFKVTVSPETLVLKQGESASYQVTVTTVDTPAGEWRFGSLTWGDKQFKVRSPIAVRASSLSAPAVVSGSGTAGSLSFDVKFGYTGAYTAAPHGLAPAVPTSDNVMQDSDQTFDPADVATGGANLHQFTLSGAAFLRLAIPPEATELDADLDVYVFDPSGALVASSTQGGTDELVDIPLPADGTWSVYVHGWAAPGGDSDYTLYSWEVPMAAASLIVDSAPASAMLGQTGTVSLSWTGLDPGTQYLGVVSHQDEDELLALTLVNVDTADTP